MGNFATGFRALFRIWSDEDFAKKIAQMLDAETSTGLEQQPPAAEPLEPEPVRSEALSLLAVLQREARFVDFIKEPISSYTDAQIGAAVRGDHKDCADVLDRFFEIKTLRSEP